MFTDFHGDEAKTKIKWPTQKNWDFQLTQFSIFFTNILGIGRWVSTLNWCEGVEISVFFSPPFWFFFQKKSFASCPGKSVNIQGVRTLVCMFWTPCVTWILNSGSTNWAVWGPEYWKFMLDQSFQIFFTSGDLNSSLKFRLLFKDT